MRLEKVILKTKKPFHGYGVECHYSDGSVSFKRMSWQTFEILCFTTGKTNRELLEDLKEIDKKKKERQANNSVSSQDGSSH